MISWLRHRSLRQKQVVIIMATSAISLLLACAAFMAYDAFAFRRELAERLHSLAGVIGNNTTAAIDFDDPASATETLAALRGESNIVRAELHRRDGSVFAHYVRAGSELPQTEAQPANERPESAGQYLHVRRQIQQAGEILGEIELVADLKAVNERLWRYTGIVGAVLGLSLLVAYLVSARLQRFVSAPIVQLARIARSVATERNYAVRAIAQSHDEIGDLIAGFNEMLGQIQVRDTALEKARESLERRVEERTRELAGSLSLLEATLESTPDGVVAISGAGRVISYNRQFVSMWDLPLALVERREAAALTAHCAGMVRDPAGFHARIAEVTLTPAQPAFDLLELTDGRSFERFWLPQVLDGQCVGSVINFRNVTARRHAEAELAFERDLLRALLDGCPDSIYFKDHASRIIRCSQSLARACGRSSPEEILGKTDFDLFGLELAAAARVDEEEIIRTGRTIIDKTERDTRADGRIVWTLSSKMPLRNVRGEIIGTMGISKDISAIKEADEKVEAVHKQLLEISRQAGMAEVATGVLHNVGNVLNSINVSTTLVAEQLRRSEAGQLARVGTLLRQHEGDLGAFLTQDPKGRQVLDFIEKLARHLERERHDALLELETLRKNVEHTKEIVAMQQTYAKVSGVAETVGVHEIVEDALRMNAGALTRHDVAVVRDFQARPVLTIERHKVLQILVNLIRNSKYACDDHPRPDKQIIIRLTSDQRCVRIAVIDNGVGIPAENLTQIFSHGFTTRKNGHGFGLHSGSLAARELGGALTGQSEGVGRGATFTLELPCAQEARTT